MNVNFKKVFGIISVIGTAIVGAATVGKEVTKYREENPKDSSNDDGHVPTEQEAVELAEASQEAKTNTEEEEMVNNVIEESEETED
jgi:hypothetical protein